MTSSAAERLVNAEFDVPVTDELEAARAAAERRPPTRG